MGFHAGIESAAPIVWNCWPEPDAHTSRKRVWAATAGAGTLYSWSEGAICFLVQSLLLQIGHLTFSPSIVFASSPSFLKFYAILQKALVEVNVKFKSTTPSNNESNRFILTNEAAVSSNVITADSR